MVDRLILTQETITPDREKIIAVFKQYCALPRDLGGDISEEDGILKFKVKISLTKGLPPEPQQYATPEVCKSCVLYKDAVANLGIAAFPDCLNQLVARRLQNNESPLNLRFYGTVPGVLEMLLANLS